MAKNGLDQTRKAIREIRDGGPQRNLAAAQLVFVLACDAISAAFRPSSYDEEPITGALSGAIASEALWMRAFAPIDPSSALDIYWGQYKKSAPVAKVELGESKIEPDRAIYERDTGADFAILIRVSKYHALLGVFQAKKCASEFNDEISIEVRYSPKRNSETAQIDRLDEYCVDLFRRLSQNAKDRGEALKPNRRDWIYYLIYRESGVQLAPLPLVVRAWKSMQAAHAGSAINTVRISQNKLQRTESLISVSSNARELAPQVPGWLTIRIEDAIAEIPVLCQLIPDVYVADDSRYGPMLTADKVKILSPRRGENPPAVVVRETLRDLYLERRNKLAVQVEPVASRDQAEGGVASTTNAQTSQKKRVPGK